MKRYKHDEIDDMDEAEAKAALKRMQREAAKEDDDEDDDEEGKGKDDDEEEDDDEGKGDSAKAALGLRLMGKLAARGAGRGLYLTDCGSVAGEELIRDFRQRGVSFVASYWGGEARFLSVGRSSSAGVRVPAATISGEWLSQTMLSGGGLDQIVASRPGKKLLSLRGAALTAMAGAMLAAV